MATVFVVRVGPIPHRKGEINLYLPLIEGEAREPVHADSDAAGLREIVNSCRGYTLTCAEELAAAGESLGFVAVPYTEAAARNAANAVVGIALNDTLVEHIHPVELMTFLEASAHFHKSSAAQAWPFGQLLSAQVTGSLRDGPNTYKINETYECVVLPGREPRLTAFSNDGDAQRMLTAAAEGKAVEVDEISRHEVRFQGAPQFVTEPLKRAWAFDELPIPSSLRVGSQVRVNSRTLLNLSGLLWATSFLDSATPRIGTERELENALGSKVHVTLAPGGTLQSTAKHLAL